MAIYHSPFAKFWLIAGCIFGALVPYKGQGIPVDVCNWTEATNPEAMFWHRTFCFPKKAPLVFTSRMEHLSGLEIGES